MNSTIIQLITFLFVSLSLHAQTNISITIDDVPNTGNFKKNNYYSKLLHKLDSLQIPVAIFVNEGLIYKTDSVSKNFDLLSNWIKRDYVTAGNHSFSHSRYSKVGYDSFKNDIERGEYITRELVRIHDKLLQYFRFPYNDLGKDSTQHAQIDALLNEKGYISTPFTVESSDWMFNYVYEHYLKASDSIAAAEIGHLYVKKTLEYFHFFDSLSMQLYGRKVNQIYLCHDNMINADYLIEILDALKEQGNTFISLETSLKDPAYQQKSRYYEKWGVSWFYRWMPEQEQREIWMNKEPSIYELYQLYTDLVEENKAKGR